MNLMLDNLDNFGVGARSLKKPDNFGARPFLKAVLFINS
jgi:hypothetical protein